MSTPPPPPPGDAPPPGWTDGSAGSPWQQPSPAWPAGTWAGVGPTTEHPQGTTVLVLGILSLVVCGILGPFAWRMGNAALREMDARPDVVWTNRSNVTAGRVCGMIATALIGVVVVFFLLWLVLAVAVLRNV